MTCRLKTTYCPLNFQLSPRTCCSDTYVDARMLNFREAQLLRFEEHEKADVNVGALFKS